MNKNEDDKRQTEKIILKEILNLKDNINKIINEVANIKAEIKIFENQYLEAEKKRIEYRKKVDEILDVLESYKFQKLMIDADDLGDQETVIGFCRKSYGYDKKYSGFDLIPEVLEEFARKKETKKEVKNFFIKKMADVFSNNVIRFFIFLFLTLFSTYLFIIKGLKLDIILENLDKLQELLK